MSWRLGRSAGLLVLAACVGAAFAVSSAHAEALKKIKGAGKIVVGTEAALPPFEFIKDGKIVGYGKDILDHIT
jgi:polar amino acid transport system substrate-binding protein